ncbi:MAG: beta-ketoacyl-[acyl-carrier-protein] synthase family protein [Sedimentisphaerales bacterium]|nr:beta-ketoacyl-[acyl-carrier-protein] synthase family protein [Sedimentisphaerales bacterium]
MPVGRTRVVITGIGAISPLGLSAKLTWEGLRAGRCGIRRITAFDPSHFSCQLAGEVGEYKIQQYVPKSFRKATKLMSRDIELAVIAADEAVRDSGLITKAIDEQKVNVEPTRMAINVGAGLISCDPCELAPAVAKSITDGKFDIRKWGKDGLGLVTPLWLLKYLPNMLACHIGIIHDIQGPSNTITCAEVSGYLSIAEAAEVIARGDSDIALAGGAEAKVNPVLIMRQCLIKRATTQSNDAPEKACRPFDADASGSVFGDGGAIVVLENLDNATKRGVKIYAELVGTGQSASINPTYEHIEPNGEGIAIAIEKAITQAGVTPKDIGLIIPHGTGIPQDDLAEAKGIETALGEQASKIPVWPTKSMLSNTGAASGALDISAAVYAMREGKIPPAKNCDKKAIGCNLNIGTTEQKTDIHYALCCGYTYGGQTAAVILKKFES